MTVNQFIFHFLSLVINPIIYPVLFVLIVIAVYWNRKILIYLPMAAGVISLLLLAIERVYRFGFLRDFHVFYDFLYHTTTLFSISIILFPIAGLIISKVQDKKADFRFLCYLPLYVLLFAAMFVVNIHYLTYIP